MQNLTKKTGLGSSAAMAVSFTAAWYIAYKNGNVGVFDSNENLSEMHVFAQCLNAFIQNKIGSGFDIACAVNGSQVYRRFTNKA